MTSEEIVRSSQNYNCSPMFVVIGKSAIDCSDKRNR